MIGVLAKIFLAIFAVDQPPKPLTVAQARLRQNWPEPIEVQQRLKKFWTEMKKLFSDLTFLLLVVFIAIALAYNVFQSLFVSEIFRPVYFSSQVHPSNICKQCSVGRWLWMWNCIDSSV